MINKSKKFRMVLIIFFSALIGLMLVSLCGGKTNLFSMDKETSKTILINIRLPRVILAVFAGMALSVSGAVFQALLNNPLADSYTLGVSSGAGLGACFAIYINTIFSIYIPIQPAAIIFSIIVLYAVLKISNTGGIRTTSNLILAGIITASTCQAGISFLKSISNENATEMVYWLMGSLASKNLVQVLVFSVIVIIGSGMCCRYLSELNIMTLGRREALLVGVDYDFINKLLLIVCTIMTAVCVSLCGIIGFVGLVVPHIVRLVIGADNRKVVPLSLLMGPILLLTADTLSRSILKYELPVGVITTMIGGPFFCYIFINKNKRMN